VWTCSPTCVYSSWFTDISLGIAIVFTSSTNGQSEFSCHVLLKPISFLVFLLLFMNHLCFLSCSACWNSD
jgi:hypothetical protein